MNARARGRALAATLLSLTAAAACGGSGANPGSGGDDGGQDATLDASMGGDAVTSPDSSDSSVSPGEDARLDVGVGDTSSASHDAGTPDATSVDAASIDATSPDAGMSDATSADAASVDAASVDATSPDAGTPDGSSSDSGAADAPNETSGGDSGSLPYPLYAHTDTVLYQVDPSTFAQTQLGAFDCIGGTGQDTAMIDLAVDGSGALWAVSAKSVYSIVVQGAVAHCATTTALSLGTGQLLDGLTFAPVGVLGSTEVLVGADAAGNVWSVNTTTGILTQHGTLGVIPATDGHGHAYTNVGKAWELSGDLVIVANHGNPVGYATARDCPSAPAITGCTATDTLLALDVGQLATATTNAVASVVGQVVKPAGCTDAANTSYGKIFGVATAGGSIVGVSRSHGVVKLSEADGSGCLVAASPLLWAGAAVSPLAAQ